MILAELNYRNNVPYGYMALECSDLNFYASGELDDLLTTLTYLIEYEKHDEYEVIIEKLSEHKRVLSEEWLEWKKEIDDFKRKHLLWILSREHRQEMFILQDECRSEEQHV